MSLRCPSMLFAWDCRSIFIETFLTYNLHTQVFSAPQQSGSFIPFACKRSGFCTRSIHFSSVWCLSVSWYHCFIDPMGLLNMEGRLRVTSQTRLACHLLQHCMAGDFVCGSLSLQMDQYYSSHSHTASVTSCIRRTGCRVSCTESVGPGGNTTDWYSGGYRFETHSQHQLS
jgi:hypothetical protein